MKSAKTKLRKVIIQIEQHVTDVYKVDIGEINQSNPVSSDLRKMSTEKKAAHLDKLTELMKGKLVNADFKTKIQVLTLTPDSWSRNFAANYFHVSEYLIQKSLRTKEREGNHHNAFLKNWKKNTK